jgi:two-component system, sensor histidine kinase PdtaS
MLFENRSARSFSIPILTIKRFLRPSAAKVTWEQNREACTVKVLEAEPARERVLLLETDALLVEQEFLRSESDHRLLNGLQMVVSLLSLQSRTAVAPEVAAQLCVAENRVATIERVHRRLHFQDGTKAVALRKYLREFCQDCSTLSSFDCTPTSELLVDGTEIEGPTSKAIPLGFIANELITNAVSMGRVELQLV